MLISDRLHCNEASITRCAPRRAILPCVRCLTNPGRSPAASSAPAQHTTAPLNHVDRETSVDAAIYAACAALGRAPSDGEAQLISRLHSNWYSTAQDLALMTHEQALALELPLRLKAIITEAVRCGSECTTAPLEPAPDDSTAASGPQQDDTALESDSQFSVAGTLSVLAAAVSGGGDDLDPDIMKRRAPEWKGRGRPPKVYALYVCYVKFVGNESAGSFIEFIGFGAPFDVHAFMTAKFNCCIESGFT